ncbi:hypothetical protein KUCAC02_007993 [Chaenocephalus aceratus]|uniref:Uncharacterized protein n=1 Tax=Chaenocephalus aceratus TaxID=36190 RepID=A0ACB9X7S4_CHAAC|nr:hypothetical protein KUCAC02_007993 [Chaenocephalus aceratus]
MVGRWNLLILALNLSIVIVLSETECPNGFNLSRRKCVDIDECEFDEDNSEGLCGNDAVCHNTFGSFYCSCEDGYRSTSGAANFSAATSVKCEDFNECLEDGGLCGPMPRVLTPIPQYSCICEAGFKSTTGVESFRNGDNIHVEMLNCDVFNDKISLTEDFPVAHDLVKRLKEESCLEITGTKTFSSKGAHLNISLKTAAGEPSYYPGFTTVSHLSYANLEDSADVTEKHSHLKEPVILTFDHLKKSNELNHTCVFWDSSKEGGSWSARGCSVLTSNPNYTVCSCNHLSSFAVLMALHEIEDTFELLLITWVAQEPPSTCTLCISLFIANHPLPGSISRTENRVGCAVVAGLLHFFFLAAFCWMCLEGIQLFRMVVLVFNTSFKTLYMMAGGYGVPAVIVAVSALANAKGYGTKRHCWLNLELIWSFFGPACVIIVVNIFFFLITVWKLAQKFSSLNPDLDNLQK